MRAFLGANDPSSNIQVLFSSKGNKATLITRIRAYENAKVPSPPPAVLRQASTVQEPHEGAVVPGIPPESQPDASLKYSYKPPLLPEQSQEAEPSIQIVSCEIALRRIGI
jgi:hypothetical protein